MGLTVLVSEPCDVYSLVGKVSSLVPWCQRINKLWRNVSLLQGKCDRINDKDNLFLLSHTTSNGFHVCRYKSTQTLFTYTLLIKFSDSLDWNRQTIFFKSSNLNSHCHVYDKFFSVPPFFVLDCLVTYSYS